MSCIFAVAGKIGSFPVMRLLYNRGTVGGLNLLERIG